MNALARLPSTGKSMVSPKILMQQSIAKISFWRRENPIMLERREDLLR